MRAGGTNDGVDVVGGDDDNDDDDDDNWDGICATISFMGFYQFLKIFT